MNEDERYCAGTFGTYDEALACARRIAEAHFENVSSTASASEPGSSYKSFGEDPIVVLVGGAPRPAERFSAWDYAAEVAAKVAGKRG